MAHRNAEAIAWSDWRTGAARNRAIDSPAQAADRPSRARKIFRPTWQTAASMFNPAPVIKSIPAVAFPLDFPGTRYRHSESTLANIVDYRAVAGAMISGRPATRTNERKAIS
ncbi:hypothetical protein [Massilia sp.]|uniref:hypothetical protein n=2 Tax=Burkholderiales TaxID=80840 RepID=UPI0028A636C5|nr:hypothetical protein [Massilia sp.]